MGLPHPAEARVPAETWAGQQWRRHHPLTLCPGAVLTQAGIWKAEQLFRKAGGDDLKRSRLSSGCPALWDSLLLGPYLGQPHVEDWSELSAGEGTPTWEHFGE